MKKIVLTGGPCGGKSTALAKIVSRFGALGWDVRVVPEVATLGIGGGVKPWMLPPDQYLAFQHRLVGVQLAMEAMFEVGAGEKTLIVCDRGVQDASAYTDPLVWNGILSRHGLNEVSARDKRYDAVIHLVTAAIGAERYYTLENNPARTETKEQAVLADHACRAAWLGHPHYRIIENTHDFDTKIAAVLKEIASVLGEPVPVEHERKFLVDIPHFPEGHLHQTFEIVQHYLNADPAHELRIRRRGRHGNWLFTRTLKRPTPDNDGRFEIEDVLSDEEYFTLLSSRPDLPSIAKNRHCFVHAGRYLELDIYPHIGRAVLEVETDEAGPIDIPPFIRVVREVTNEPAFSNREMALAAARG